MSERDADAFWPSEPTTKAEVAPPPRGSEERAADVMFGPPPPPPREQRVVAKAANSHTAGDILYGVKPTPAEATSEPSEADQAEPKPAEQAEKADKPEKREPDDPADLLQVLPDMMLRAPEGFTEFDQAGLDLMAPILQEHDIKAPAAQALLDLHVQRLEEEGQAAQHALLEHLQNEADQQRATWKQETLNDAGLKSYGLKQARSDAKAVLDTYFDPSFRDTLNQLGLLSHPGLVRSLLHVRESLTAASMRNTGYNYQRKYMPSYARRKK